MVINFGCPCISKVLVMIIQHSQLLVKQYQVRVMATIAPWFRLHLPSCGPAFESKAHYLCFFLKKQYLYLLNYIWTPVQTLLDPLYCSMVIIHLGSASILWYINSNVNEKKYHTTEVGSSLLHSWKRHLPYFCPDTNAIKGDLNSGVFAHFHDWGL